MVKRVTQLVVCWSLLVGIGAAHGQSVTIDNDIPRGTFGHWSVLVQPGGESRSAFITAHRAASDDIFTENVLFDYFSYVDVGPTGGAFRLGGTAPVVDPTDPDRVESTGSFIGATGVSVHWRATSYILDGDLVMTTIFEFETVDGSALGPLRFFQYMDEDVEFFGDDVFFFSGTPAGRNLELFTLDNQQVYGVSQSGIFDEASGLENATFVGWAADVYNNIKPRLEGGGQAVDVGGIIQNLPTFNHSVLGPVLGPRDIVSVLAWDLDPIANRGVVVTSLGGLPDAATAFEPPEIPPPGARSLETSDVIGFVDPSKPTIILTHGLQPENSVPANMWTGFGSAKKAGDLIRADLSDSANVLQFLWDEANQVEGIPGRDEYVAAWRNVYDAGEALAKRLDELLGPDYSRNLHFIGHSLGTAVNAYAARRALTMFPNVHETQVTILDYPNHVTRIPGMSDADEDVYGFDPDFFAATLPIARSDLELRIDNYYTRSLFTGVGDRADGPVYNHDAAGGNGLVEPNDVGGKFFPDESTAGFDNEHSGVHQWYRWTISPTDPFPIGATVCDGADFAPGRRPFGFDESLNPCEKGWYWAINYENPLAWVDRFPASNGKRTVVSTPDALLEEPLDLENFRSFGCTSASGSTVVSVDCVEASSPFAIADVVIPESADFLAFDYAFLNQGDGDYLAIFLDDLALWVLKGTNAVAGEVVSVPPLSVRGLRGPRRLTIALYGVGEKNARTFVEGFRVLTVPPARSAVVDIKPGSAVNSINPRSHGSIPVAVLTTADFDAGLIADDSVRFGRTGVEAPAFQAGREDVDGDGDLDVVYHFRTDDTGIRCGDTSAQLSGLTSEPRVLEGSDSIRTVGCQ